MLATRYYTYTLSVYSLLITLLIIHYFIFHPQSTNGPTGPTGKVPSRHRDVFLHHLILEAIWMNGAGIGMVFIFMLSPNWLCL